MKMKALILSAAVSILSFHASADEMNMKRIREEKKLTTQTSTERPISIGIIPQVLSRLAKLDAADPTVLQENRMTREKFDKMELFDRCLNVGMAFKRVSANEFQEAYDESKMAYDALKCKYLMVGTEHSDFVQKVLSGDAIEILSTESIDSLVDNEPLR